MLWKHYCANINLYGVKYWQDAMLETPEFTSFRPDLIFIHTSNRNITQYPTSKDNAQMVKELLDAGYTQTNEEVYAEFQQCLKAHQQKGIILNVISKNEPENALAGLNRPDSVLKPNNFIVLKANWEPMSENLQNMVHELPLLPESLVFIADNPTERAIIHQVFPLTPEP